MTAQDLQSAPAAGQAERAKLRRELGAAIPDEGGAYVWVRTAFGRFAGALTSLLSWAGTPMWLGGSPSSPSASPSTAPATGSTGSRSAT
jgi:amino acid transporter